MGKSTISMAIFNSYVKLPEGTLFIFASISFVPIFCRSNPSLFVLQHPIEIVLIVLWFMQRCSTSEFHSLVPTPNI